MVITDKSVNGYLTHALLWWDNVAKFIQHNPYYDLFEYVLLGTLEAIRKNPDGDIHMEFEEFNPRYGYKTSTTAVISEVISMINLTNLYPDKTLIFATNKRDQSDRTIDFSLVGEDGAVTTYQTKTAQCKNNRIRIGKDWDKIKTDYVCLVDIDNYDHWVIPTQYFLKLLNPTGFIQLSNLISDTKSIFKNTLMYGTNTDKLIYNKVML
jgi:hypothetical protein